MLQDFLNRSNNFASAFAYALEKLRQAGHVANAQREVCQIFTHVFGFNATDMLLKTVSTFPEGKKRELEQVLLRRCEQFEPLEYILGKVEFLGMQLTIKKPVLIPRVETEEWVAVLIQKLEPFKDRPLKILDLCTGSGCIALALAQNLDQAQIVGSDVCVLSLRLANQNKANLGLKNVSFVCSNLFAALQGQKFDLIVSNPPYVSQVEFDQLPASVKSWEDERALLDAPGGDGLSFYRKILEQAPKFLTDQPKSLFPRLIFEIGSTQAGALQALVKNSPSFSELELWQDSFGKDRAIFIDLRQQ